MSDINSLLRLYTQYAATLAVVLLLLVTSHIAQAAQLPDFTEMTDRVGSSVVNISSRGVSKSSSPHSPFGEHEGPGIPFGHSESLGSGFILDKDGHILTNYHVISEADEIIVRLTDRREFPATVIGIDKRSDIALLKIEAKDLEPVVVGDSSQLKKGEWVMAIGSPFGFDNSVSVGVISFIGRNLPSESYVPFIQTDVAINPGNSGGPLFNLNGEVIGINSQIYSRTGGFMGLSFAIPIDVAIDVVTQLQDKGKVSRGWLGLLIQDVDARLAESFGMKNTHGAVVLEVLEDSPAQKAGFQEGDVVIKFGKTRIYNSRDLPLAVGSTQVGKKTRVKIIREGKKKTITVVVGELPTEDELVQHKVSPDTHSNFGLKLDDLTADARSRLDMPKGGAVIIDVSKGPARNAGLQRGDIILKIGPKRIKNARHARDILTSLPANHSVPVLIQRQGSPVYLALTIPGK